MDPRSAPGSGGDGDVPVPAPFTGNEVGVPPPAPGTGDEAGVPTCFRHPDKETYLSCVRCGRPACPDCLRSAPVGQQCVECIKEGSRGARTPTTVFGGRVVSGALVTYTLIGLNVLLYLVEWVYPRIVDYLVLVGRLQDSTLHNQVIGVAVGQEYRLITSAFLHEPGFAGFGPAHIIFNMWALLVVGPALERLLGRVRFLAVYLLSALGGAVFFYYLVPPNQAALGASGAVFGLFGAAAIGLHQRGINVWQSGVGGLIVVNLVLSFIIPGISIGGHLGGLVGGFVCGAFMLRVPTTRRSVVDGVLVAGVISALAVAGSALVAR